MRQVVVTAAVIRRDGKILLAQRRDGAHLAGAWEFPGGRVEPGEHPAACLKREVAEELGCTVQVGSFYDLEPHVYPEDGKQVFLLFYLCHLVAGEPRPLEAADVAWVAPADLPAWELAPADRRVAARLATEANGRPG